ncbi:MAG: hypothetical protein LBD70_05585 [Bifidobacteriaceae bacterium]|jgi:membrane protein YqaA with SNARE-associated domain|nr:hypothetical protein [Bifidobacteriaceae bacterium]
MASLTAIAILVAASLGVGFASAFVPWINAELLTLAAVAAATTSLAGAVGAVVAVTVGQTTGKVVVYEAARAGRRWTERRADEPSKRPAEPGERRRRWRAFKAWVKRWSDRGLALMNTRGRRLGVVAVSATVGFPPLLITTVAAGAVKMHRLDFVAVTLVGRLLRFAAVAWPALALRF